MGGTSSKATQVLSTPNWDPVRYSGTWVEVGRYIDPSKTVCNDMRVHVVGSDTQLDVTYSCGCGLKDSTSCGKDLHFVATRVGDTAMYQPVAKSSSGAESFVVMYTDYLNWSVVTNENVTRVSIYKRVAENEQLVFTFDDYRYLYAKLKELGLLPSSVLLTGSTIRALSTLGIYTGTLIDPFCYSDEGQIYGSGMPNVCDHQRTLPKTLAWGTSNTALLQ